MHFSKKSIGMASCATGLVLTSLAFGAAAANAAPTAHDTAKAASSTSATRAVSAPEIEVVARSSGAVTVSVQAAPGTFLRFEDDTRRTTTLRIGPSGTNTVSIRVDDGRVTPFQVTSVLDGESLVSSWSVDTREQPDPGNPGGPGDQGDAPTVQVTGYAHGYATLAVTGKAGQTYSVTDSSGQWAGSGVLGTTAKNVSVAAPEGRTTYTVSVKEAYEVVGSTTVVVDPSGATDPEQPVAPTPEPGNPGDPENPGNPGNPGNPEDPEVPGGPENPGDPGAPIAGDVTVGAVSNGYASVTVSGPIGAQFMITNENGGYVTGGFIEGRSVTRQLVVGSGAVKTFTLHMEGGTKTFTVDAR